LTEKYTFSHTSFWGETGDCERAFIHFGLADCRLTVACIKERDFCMRGLKEKLKKIKWLRNIVRTIKSLFRKAKRPFDSMRSVFYLGKSRRRRHTSDKIRIGFLVQPPTSWDKQMNVYENAKRRENTEVFMFVIPIEDFDTYKIVPDYTDNYFCENYPESIKLLNEDGSCIDLAAYHLDYLFYPRPYDYRIPEMVQSSRMVKYTKCCYIPYAFTAFLVFHEHMLKNTFFYNQYFFFADSLYVQSSFEKKYRKSVRAGLRKIEFLGYPSFEKYLALRNSKDEGYITWTPRWSFDSAEGGSTFLLFKENFADFIRATGRKAIFRPHPLIHAEIIRAKLMTQEEWDAYMNELRELNVVIDTSSPIDDILKKTDILISDFSSIIISFFLTGRPVIYCDSGVVLTEEYNELMKHLYVAKSWNDVLNFYNDIADGNDSLKSDRAQYIDEMYSDAAGSADKIVDCICRDYAETAL
jgi:hypothetical protein